MVRVSLLLTIQIGNFGYFLFLFLLGTLVYVSRQLCSHFGKGFSNRLILTLLWGNFALHFLKQLSPFYMLDFPFSLTRSSLENYCAVLIVASPFIYQFGNDYLKDYLYYIGVISGVIVYLFPTAALGADLRDPAVFFDVMRFYLCHAPLVICGFLMVDQGFHRLDYHRLWAIPFLFVAVNFMVFVNAVFMGPVLHFPGWPITWSGISNRDGFVNQSMTFGPPPAFDAIFISWLYPILPPGLCTYYVDGVIHFTPAVWQFLPVGFATLVLGPLLALPYEKRHMKMDFLAFVQKRRLRH